jgi:hypothetical protein
MLGLRAYTVVSSAGEPVVLDPAGTPVAVVLDEPWPEVPRRWWLARWLKIGRDPPPSRTVIRRVVDDRPTLRLHHPYPVFARAVVVFDADDRKAGYLRWGFKGTGPRGSFALVRVGDPPPVDKKKVDAGTFNFDPHRLANVEPVGRGAFQITGVDGRPWARIAVGPDGRRVELADAAFGHPEAELFVLAAALELPTE